MILAFASLAHLPTVSVSNGKPFMNISAAAVVRHCNSLPNLIRTLDHSDEVVAKLDNGCHDICE
jgi:hypothetical protein